MSVQTIRAKNEFLIGSSECICILTHISICVSLPTLVAVCPIKHFNAADDCVVPAAGSVDSQSPRLSVYLNNDLSLTVSALSRGCRLPLYTTIRLLGEADGGGYEQSEREAELRMSTCTYRFPAEWGSNDNALLEERSGGRHGPPGGSNSKLARNGL